MNYTKGKWKVQPYVGAYPIEIKDKLGRLIACVSTGTYGEAKPNADLIVTAVNACISVNPDNPQAVGEAIGEMYKALEVTRTLVEDLKREFPTLFTDSEMKPVWTSYETMVLQALAKAEGAEKGKPKKNKPASLKHGCPHCNPRF